ncbi:MAG: ATP-binding protein [Betaproteobacteria bacterium]
MRSNIRRHQLSGALQTALRRSPAVALLGPRQVGKTTLARQFLQVDSPNYFDLENPLDLARLAEPMATLAPLRGLIVIDEVQRRAELFPALRVLLDRAARPARFLILGSASPALLKQSSESLAGRLEIIDTPGFALREVGATQLETLWSRGSFPPAFLAENDVDSLAWRENFIRLTVERDLPALGLGAPSVTVRRFWSMVAHYHGQVWNSAEPARALGVSEPTVRRYLDFLTDADLVRQVQPWVENLGKRQVKSPKVYVRDSGLLHALFNLGTLNSLLAHPKAGASWEGFLLEEVLKAARPDQAYFWATHQGAELDLLMLKGTRRIGVEFKRADAPALTPSMRIAMADLRLDALYVLYPGTKRYSLADRVEVLPATSITEFKG